MLIGGTSMNGSEIFKTEFKGYSKREVIEYISSLNSQMEQLKADLDRSESELEKCKAELAEKDNVQPEESVSVGVDAIYAEAYEKAKSEFESKNSDEDLEKLRTKARMYDEQKELIAEIVIKAKSDANDITNAAQQKANDLLTISYEKFEKACEDFVQMRKNIEAGKSELDARLAAVSHYLNDFSQYLNILEQDVKNTGDNFKNNI
jgi:cell division septum initiation protein DivIVA